MKTKLVTRNEMMRRLADIQNQFGHQDILTITGLLSDEELALHLERYEEKSI